MQEPTPFDGKHMICGGFAPLLDECGGASSYAERLDCPGHRSAGADFPLVSGNRGE
jgi:hypothetical protein